MVRSGSSSAQICMCADRTDWLPENRLFSLYHNIRFIDPRKIAMAAQVLTPSPLQISTATATPSTSTSTGALPDQQTPDGLVKAILPCTPLAIVKTLEHCQVYNPLRPYGSRAFGRTITVVNRSEVVGRPLAALLANDGARVFSVDLDGVQEFTRKKVVEGEDGKKSNFHPYHVIKKCDMSLEQCLAASDVVIGGVSCFPIELTHPAFRTAH
jgi:methylenetetrahydrofolate dehydrogenase (NAD+)